MTASPVVPRWSPRVEPTRKEKMILKRLKRHRRLFAFLRHHRHELFDEAFQKELASMYRRTGSGKEPKPPALLAMATLLQAYTGASDAEAVELSVMDLRWQMVLDVLGSEEPAFSQGALCAFRARLIRHEMDRGLLLRSVELAQETGAFDPKKLPTELRVAIDSRPLEGAGRVEDTINLLGRAARQLLLAAARVVGRPAVEVARELEAPLLVSRSIKSGLDVDWGDPIQRNEALRELLEQIGSLEAWVREVLPQEASQPPLSTCFETLAKLRDQDLDPDPPGGKARINKGVAKDRQPSVSDPEMRHGRKSKSKLINGYKSHLAADLDRRLVLACAITPANQPEREALAELNEELAVHLERRPLGELHIDRGYVASEMALSHHEGGGEVLCKPRSEPVQLRYTKRHFDVDLQRKTVTCPRDQQVSFSELPQVVHFPAEACDRCEVRPMCAHTRLGRGRSISLTQDEALQQKLRPLPQTPEGRARLRERIAIEHRLAHHAQKQGRQARYRGVRKNLFDARRTAAVNNLEVIDHQLQKAA